MWQSGICLSNTLAASSALTTNREKPLSTSQDRIPPIALYLGLAGLLPFLGCALLTWMTSPDERENSVLAILAYGAVILSFLGGVRWGNVLRDTTALTHVGPLSLSIAPSLVGWVALLASPRPGLILLIVGFAIQYTLDRTAANKDQLPRWYGRLRTVLSAGAITSLLVAFAAVLILDVART